MNDIDPLYITQEAADMLRAKPRTMERWRGTGDGPRYVKVGRHVCYRHSDLERWLEGRVRRHTGETR